MQKVWGKLSDEKRNLIVKALATPKDWTSLWKAVEDRIGSKTTLNIYLRHLQDRGTVVRSVDEKRRVTYRLADPRQEALAAKSIEIEGAATRALLEIREEVIEAIRKIEAAEEPGERSFFLTDKTAEECRKMLEGKREQLARSKLRIDLRMPKPTLREAKLYLRAQALEITHVYVILVELYLDALATSDKEIAFNQWTRTFALVIEEIRSSFRRYFGIPIKAGFLREEHLRQACDLFDRELIQKASPIYVRVIESA